MYEEIILKIKSNLGENKQLNREYLSSQIDNYKDHPYSKEIIREISRMLWDCLSDEEKEEYIQITEEETPIIDILEETATYIQKGENDVALEKIETFMKNYPVMFEDDKVSEYHSFTNPLEEILFDTYIGAKKEVRYIPDNQPLLDLYYIYGYILIENQQLEKAEESLKKALKINPVSSRVILELTEIYKIKTPTFNKFYMYTEEALKYAYYTQDIGRCYRNLGYYYIEEEDLKTAAALFIFSMEYDLSPATYNELEYIKSKGQDIELNLEESIKIIEEKNIPVGPNPFIIKTVTELANDYRNSYSPNRALYFYEILYGLTKDENVFEIIKELQEKINN